MIHEIPLSFGESGSLGELTSRMNLIVYITSSPTSKLQGENRDPTGTKSAALPSPETRKAFAELRIDSRETT